MREHNGRVVSVPTFPKNIVILGVVITLILSLGQDISSAEKITIDSEYIQWRNILLHLIEMKNDIKIVEVRVVKGSAFEVTNSFFGDLKVGRELLFRDCDQIRISGSSADYLLSLLRAPILDDPVNDDNSIKLVDSRQLNNSNSTLSDASDSFIMILWRVDGEHWGFTRQTYGDFFLVHHKKIFRLTGESHDIWVPLAPIQSYSEFVKLLKQEIKGRRESSDRH